MNIRETLKSVGPAIIVAAVVLGPGSILASSKVGAEWGWLGLPVLAFAVVLMIGMVALSSRLGVVYKGSLCDELASRLGRGTAVAVGVVLFGIVALYQSSNNLALGVGLEPLFLDDTGGLPEGWATTQIVILILANGAVIASLYLMRSLYSAVEKAMKILVLFMVIAFVLNLLTAMFGEAPERNAPAPEQRNLIPLIALVGTTFSVGGAFFQAYLVREKGWGMRDLRKGTADSVVGITVLGLVSAVIMVTSLLVFHRVSGAPENIHMGAIAGQLEPLFGSGAKYVFCAGFLAGALSSFMVNAAIGGTVLSDSLGKGAKMEDPWARHFTALALVFGMAVGVLGILSKENRDSLMLVAQALTVFGIPALGLAMLYLAMRPELKGERRVPPVLKAIAWVGIALAIVLAIRKVLLWFGG
ncbi:MAG: divalent metal cation transporter [Roseibacillus sp.]|nr:divalent metal cation transporter [Roseibacillus sp.]